MRQVFYKLEMEKSSHSRVLMKTLFQFLQLVTFDTLFIASKYLMLHILSGIISENACHNV